jgi:lysophospholipase L1-like esterase
MKILKCKIVCLSILLFSLMLHAGIVCSKDYTVVDIVGDSISVGANPDFYDQKISYGWVHMLFGVGDGALPPPQTYTIDSLWPGIKKFNSSRSGTKASDWVTSSILLFTPVLNHHPDLVIVMIGGNDFLKYINDNQITQEEMDEFRFNLETIIDILRSIDPEPDVILLDYYDLADGYSQNLLPHLAKYRWITQATEEGNRIIHETAKNKGVYLVSIYDAFLHHAYGMTIGDTKHTMPMFFRFSLSCFDVHPITAGHAAIYTLVYQRLKEFKNNEFLAAKNWSFYP